jgi:hypothetical protein
MYMTYLIKLQGMRKKRGEKTPISLTALLMSSFFNPS